MSRMGHRKSQSTSALAVIASGSDMSSSASSSKMGVPQRRHRASQHPVLGRVDESQGIPPLPTRPTKRPSGDEGRRRHEGMSSSASMTTLPGLTDTPKQMHEKSHHANTTVEDVRRRKSSSRVVSMDDLRAWKNDILSLRSSERRRLAALRNLEKTLVYCCSRNDAEIKGKRQSEVNTVDLATFVSFDFHSGLIYLLTRHAQTLSSRQTQTSLGSEESVAVLKELYSIVAILQGLCLLSLEAKAAAAQSWILEILIDLLLLLRTQPPLPLPSGQAADRSIVYMLLDLLCCVLADSSANARTFEALNGLEAVSRVLKGTGVAKEIRMKCVEFLYFYLLPEGATPSPARAVSASSASSSSSAESQLFPPSPLSSSTSSAGSTGRTSPSPNPNLVHESTSHEHYLDLDVPFVAQTPKKPVQPSLGYLTPSAASRRVSGSRLSTPSLASVPGSPNKVPPTPSTRVLPSSAASRRWSVIDAKDRTPVTNPGLGLGLPKSASMASGLDQTPDTRAQTPPTPGSAIPGALRRDLTAIKLDEISTATGMSFSDPFNAPDSRSSSGSSTAMPETPLMSDFGSDMSRSSSQMQLDQHPTVTVRKSSIKRSSRLPNVQSQQTPSIPQSSSSRIVPSASSSRLSRGDMSGSESNPEGGRQPRMRHSRTQSLLSGLPEVSSSTPPVPRLPRRNGELPGSSSMSHGLSVDSLEGFRMPSARAASPNPFQVPGTPAHASTSNTTAASAAPRPRSSDRSMPPPAIPSPQLSQPTPQKALIGGTPAKRGFPASLTKGLPPSSSSPNFATPIPLGASKRVISGARPSLALTPSHPGPMPALKAKGVRSVEEKKELLGSWIGNVDALVQGVEKVSFWGNITKSKGRG